MAEICEAHGAVKSCVLQFYEGVERVKADCHDKTLTLTAKGTVQPAWLRKQVEIKTKKKADDDKKPKEAAVTAVVMKINLHCDQCANKIKRIILKNINGINSVMTDLQNNLVTLVGSLGTMDAKELTAYLKERLKRNVEIIPLKKVDSGGGEKKEKEGGGDKKDEEDSGGGKRTKFQKVVWILAVNDERSKQKVLEEVSSCYGVEYAALDMKDKKLTVIGNMDVVAITNMLWKKFYTDIVSIEPTNEAMPRAKPQLELQPEVPEKEQPEKGYDEKMADLVKLYKTYNPNLYYYQHQYLSNYQQFQGQVASNPYYYQHQCQPYQLQEQVTPNLYYHQDQYPPYQRQGQVTPNFYYYQDQSQPYQLRGPVAPYYQSQCQPSQSLLDT